MGRGRRSQPRLASAHLGAALETEALGPFRAPRSTDSPSSLSSTSHSAPCGCSQPRTRASHARSRARRRARPRGPRAASRPRRVSRAQRRAVRPAAADARPADNRRETRSRSPSPARHRRAEGRRRVRAVDRRRRRAPARERRTAPRRDPPLDRLVGHGAVRQARASALSTTRAGPARCDHCLDESSPRAYEQLFVSLPRTGRAPGPLGVRDVSGSSPAMPSSRTSPRTAARLTPHFLESPDGSVGFCHRPGRGGQRPASVSIARAITALGEWKPKPRRVISRIWVFTCSTRAFES